MRVSFGFAPLRGFVRRQDGGATVEAVLWIPVFMLVFGLMVDASMIFYGQSAVLRVVQDANRNFSVGRLDSASATETYVENRLAASNIAAVATSTVVAGVVTTTVSVPAGQLQILGYFGTLRNLKLTIRSEQVLEDWEA
jgi:Flp pilus assembly protein TadG